MTAPPTDEPATHPSCYLPEERFPEIENALFKAKMAGKIYPASELPSDILSEMYGSACNNIITKVRHVYNIDQDIQFILVDSETPNALAISQGNDINCVCVSTAFLLDLLAAFSKLFLSQYFQAIWSQAPTPPFFGPFPRNRKEGVRWVFLDGPMEPPNELSFALTELALFFVVSHELGHLINGHLRSGVLNTLFMSESFIEHDKNLLQTRRALELDADCFAVQEMINIAYHLSVSNEEWPGKKLTLNFEMAFITIAVAISSVVQLIEAHDTGLTGEFLSRSHPPSYIRNWGCGAVAMTICEKRLAQSSAPVPVDYEALWTRASGGVGLAVFDLGQCAFDVDEHNEWQRMTEEHDRANLMRWAKLRSFLEKAKFGSHKLATAQFTVDGHPLKMLEGKYWTGQ